ncbi:MAG: UDP-3-O-(3-hydroxymyristoyl)glucosamine N-acyltransferase [Bacteroidia bacterium]|nr:UDP-3-O-(3-hydroxymyristoyl)glucosamine N-acyltransferase [Bacteroidia bacterium]
MMDIQPTPVQLIANIIQAKIVGNASLLVTGINEIHCVREGDIVFVDHPKYYQKALQSKASVVIINQETECPDTKALLIHDQPFTAFNQLIRHFQPIRYSLTTISPSAQIGKHTIIFPNVYIGNNVIIGDHTIIYPNTVIYDNCVIGNHVKIHANCTIGADAFYYKKHPDSFEQLETCGNVCIEDYVHIGANCTIDKGVTSSTIIGAHTKLDNHVHVGHDTKIGKRCLIAAHTGIAGATTIGDYVTIWGQVGISSGIHIGNNVTILAQSGVGENISDGQTYFGSPAGPAKEKMREVFAVKQLVKLIHKLY